MKKQLNKFKVTVVVSLFLALCLVICLMPTVTLAAGYGDKGYNTTMDNSYKIDGNDIFVYITGSGGYVERISGGDGNSVQQYRATASENWEFAYWSTYYVGPITKNSNPVAVLGYYYFSKPGDNETAYNKTNNVIQVNKEIWAAGAFYLQAIFKPKITVSVNKNIPSSSLGIRGNSPATDLDNVFISGSSGYVPFGGSIEVSLSGFTDDYIVESVSVNDGAPRHDFNYGINTAYNKLEVFFTATRPTNVIINVKLKEQLVAFDSNTGSGAIETQTFESGEEKTLSLNTFTKTGFLFDGWNTAADGSGISYTDGQSVSFTPANDGDTVTLYAQWKLCTQHNYENNICTKCGFTDTHIYTYSANNNVITETCANGCAHNETAVLEQDSNVSTVYNGSAIEALKVSYSDKWQGGDLTVSYVNNTNVGNANGSIEKNGSSVTKSFEILKAPLTVTANDKTVIYGEGAPFNDVTYFGFVNGESQDILNGTLDFSCDGYTPKSNVGTYEIIPSGLTSDNYEITFEKGTLTVNPKELFITWGDTNFIYDGTEKFPEFSVDGVIAGDSIRFEFSGAATDVGENYVAQIVGITGFAMENYKLPDNTSVTFNISNKVDDNSNSGEKGDGNVGDKPLKDPSPQSPSSQGSASAGTPESDASTIPNTKDTSLLWLWCTLLCLSGMGILLITFKERKNNK